MFGLSSGLTKEKVLALFKLAEFKQVDDTFTLVNEYWPDAYPEAIRANPWFMLKTPFGLIKIGARKRVVEINWEHTSLRQKPPNLVKPAEEDEGITKEQTYVHCYDFEQVSRRLWWLREELEKKAKIDALSKPDPLTKRFRDLMLKLHYEAKGLRHPLSGEVIGIAFSNETYKEIAGLDDLIRDIEKGRAACPT